MKNFHYLIILFIMLNYAKAEENRVYPLLLSVVVPGGGQFYHGKIVKGSIYATVELGFLYGAYIQDQRFNRAKNDLAKFDGSADSYIFKKLNHELNFYQKERNNFIWYSVATMFLSVGDAFVDSYFVDFKRNKFAKLEITPRYNGLTLGYNF